MATDGVKIIDGDTAHETYWGIMDLYDSQADIETIERDFPIYQRDYFDDFDNEIYVTSCALALWEIGQMTKSKLDFVKSVLEKGACVKEWTEENESSGKARQKELDKFWKKISQANHKVRPRKTYRKITNFYFQPDDLLTFQLKDGNYKAVVCIAIDQYRGQCNYILVPTTYSSPKKPAIDDIKDKEIIGRRVGSGYDQQVTKEKQPGIERVWNYEFEGGNCNYFFGVEKLAVDHKDFISFKHKFEKIGTLKIVEGLKETGSYGYEGNFEGFERVFSDIESHIKIFQFKKYPVKVLCDI
jgi:hypothetical protein